MTNFHELIDLNFSHPNYGRLLQHRDKKNPNILHYSVQLNHSDSLAWEPSNSGKEKDRGKLAIWPIKNNFKPDQTKSWSKENINKALHISVKEFHENWLYELYRFNCEHWARLVATGDCRCYQIAEFKKLQKNIPVFGFLIVGVAGAVTGAWEHNGYAQKIVDDFT